MCSCAICNNSKYFQEFLNAWRRKQLKIMKDKADNSCGSKIYELTQSYKSYADYVFLKNETRHSRCEMQQIVVFVHRLMMNFNCPIGNLYCGSVLPVLLLFSQELKEIHQTELQLLCLTRILLNTCSHHGILIREIITTYLDARGTSKQIFSYMNN